MTANNPVLGRRVLHREFLPPSWFSGRFQHWFVTPAQHHQNRLQQGCWGGKWLFPRVLLV